MDGWRIHQCQRKASEWACVSVGVHAVTFFSGFELGNVFLIYAQASADPGNA